MKRTDRIPLSPRRPSLSGRFLYSPTSTARFRLRPCSPCAALIGPVSRPRDFFPRSAMANALYPRLIALNSPRRIHPRHTSHKKVEGLLRKTLRFSPESPPIFLKIPRFPKEYGELFDLGRLQNAESRTKKIYFGLATCEKLLTFVVR